MDNALPKNTLLHDRYRIDAVLGDGGFGITYRATDTELGLTVALKELYPRTLYRVSRDADHGLVVPKSAQADHSNRVRRVLKEGRIFTEFRHPHLVKIYEAFKANNTAYLVMAFLEGSSLRDVLRGQGKMPAERVQELLRQIGEGLTYLHERDVLHLDIKPSNILYSDGRYVLIDYGEAKAAGEALTVELSSGGATPYYMALEQWDATLDKGPYTDLYAFGVTLYECLTGQRPPHCVARMAGRTLETLDVADEELKRRVTWAMEVMPKDRPASVQAWLRQGIEVEEPVTVPLSRVEDHEPEALFPARKDWKWGFIDMTGQFVIDPQFDGAMEFSEDLAPVELDGKWGFIDTTGQFVIKSLFDQAQNFSDGLAKVVLDDKYGYIDKNGQLVIKPHFYDIADDFFEGLARVKLGDKYGYIDMNGRLVIKPHFDWTGGFSEDLARVKLDHKWGWIDKNGWFVIDPQFSEAGDLSEGLARITLGHKWGWIDRSGRFVIDPQFDGAGRFNKGMACAKLEGKYGYIDKIGRFLIDPRFDIAYAFEDDLAPVNMGGRDSPWLLFEINGKWGWIDKTGGFVIKPKFDKVWGFEEGLAKVRLDHKFGYIDMIGRFVTKPQFDNAGNFSKGLATVWLDYNRGYINREGTVVWWDS